MRFRNFVAAALSASLLTLAQGSEPLIQSMVTDSPWARPANVRLKGQIDIAGGLSNGTVGARMGDDLNGTESVQRDSGSAPPRIVVRWDSAAPVRDACAAGHLERYLFSCYSKLLYLSGQSQQFTELAGSFYIVTVANFPGALAPARARYAPQHSAAANSALEQMGQHLRGVTAIRRKGKNPFRPARVLVLPAGQDFLIIAFFPRTEPIASNDRNLSFELVDGAIEIEARFDLRKMIYNGALAL